MQYLLVLHMNPVRFQALSEDELNVEFRGHEALRKEITASCETAGTNALADSSISTRVCHSNDGLRPGRRTCEGFATAPPAPVNGCTRRVTTMRRYVIASIPRAGELRRRT
jgi:hypothetical protein